MLLMPYICHNADFQRGVWHTGEEMPWQWQQ